ncbi:MAG TPA: hypothetical protein VEX68_26945 [Bryobacteraceae bacterium]|nr:hypothetical protein [Bryobacteraceae bacterium]
MKIFAIAIVAALPCLAQIHNLKVYSEFTRIDPFGQIVAQDKGPGEPRHILSPGAPRNAFSSLRIVVTMDKPGKYILDIGQNPENAVKATLYKERFEKHGNQWIPDGLEPVKIPYEGVFPESETIPGQTAVTFWLDMWVARNAEVDRIKVEPQVWIGYADDWFTYPMEVRILDAVLPDVSPKSAALPEITERSDASVLRPMRAVLCGSAEPAGKPIVNARAFVRRNSLQYLALSKSVVTTKLLQVSKTPTLQQWCASKADKIGPEWFLRFRDLLGQTP